MTATRTPPPASTLDGPRERYLERKFGAPYRAYRERVRRWL